VKEKHLLLILLLVIIGVIDLITTLIGIGQNVNFEQNLFVLEIIRKYGYGIFIILKFLVLGIVIFIFYRIKRINSTGSYCFIIPFILIGGFVNIHNLFIIT